MFKFKEDDDPLIKVTAVHDQDQCQIGFQPSNATVLSIIVLSCYSDKIMIVL